ncbi:MAG: glycosyltransferase family 4 protein [Novosphingobium sp.]
MGHSDRPGIGVFHPGTQHSWQTALALDQLGRLAWYATSIYHQPDRFPYRAAALFPGAVGARVRAKLAAFRHPELDPSKVRTAGVAEWLERIAGNLGAHALALRLDAWGNRRFGRQLGGALAQPDCGGVWGYNGSSLEAFELARAAGKATILDRTIGDWRAYNAVMAHAAVRSPEWFVESERGADAGRIERDDREYEAADLIVCGAESAAATVRRHARDPATAAKVRVLPYTFDSALFAAAPPPQPLPRDRPVRFLFLGLVIPRKGIHHLLEATARLPRGAAELTVVGKLGVPPATFARFADRITYVPGVARGEVPAIMAQADVLVLPSYFEGSALTLLEALAAGMAVIQTAQAGNGADASTGIVLDRPDTDALAAAMLTAIDDRDRLDRWRAAAQARARQFDFSAYRDNIAALLGEARI